MALTRINNQAVKLYTPTETRFNEKTSVCEWHLDYFPLVTCDDITEIVIDATKSTGSDISLDPDFGSTFEGDGTSQSPFKLIDSNADFDGSGGGSTIVTTQMIVENTDTGATANVISVDSAIQLTLDADIFVDVLDTGYFISFYELSGNTSISAGTLVKTSGAVGSVTQSPLASGNAYEISIDLLSVTSTGVNDTITVIIGGNTVAVYDASELEATTLSFYGNASSTDFTIEFGADVEATFTQLQMYEVSNAYYYVRKCEDDEIVYTSTEADVAQSILSTQIKLTFDWSNLMDGEDCNCGCYYIEIYEDVAYATAEFTTDCFQMCESHDCTVKLSGTNNDNAFGIDFLGTSYTPFVRILGELEPPKFSGDKENEEDSSGVSETLYFKSETDRDLFIYQQPIHIHSFIRLLIGYDQLLVDGVEYVSKDASYSPEYERISGKIVDLTNATKELRLKDDLNENRYC